jgi:hypothetical protein
MASLPRHAWHNSFSSSFNATMGIANHKFNATRKGRVENVGAKSVRWEGSGRPSTRNGRVENVGAKLPSHRTLFALLPSRRGRSSSMAVRCLPIVRSSPSTRNGRVENVGAKSVRWEGSGRPSTRKGRVEKVGARRAYDGKEGCLHQQWHSD